MWRKKSNLYKVVLKSSNLFPGTWQNIKFYFGTFTWSGQEFFLSREKNSLDSGLLTFYHLENKLSFHSPKRNVSWLNIKVLSFTDLSKCLYQWNHLVLAIFCEQKNGNLSRLSVYKKYLFFFFCGWDKVSK